MKLEKVISTGEAAKILGVSVSTVYTYEKRGILHPVTGPGKQRKWNLAEVDSISQWTCGYAIYDVDGNKIEVEGLQVAVPICDYLGMVKAYRELEAMHNKKTVQHTFEEEK